MTRRYERTAWQSLPPEVQERFGPRDVRGQIEAQAEEFRAECCDTFQAFVARDGRGHRAGFVWVQEVRHGFTGEARGYVLELYVSRSCRGQGLGRLLMERAEEWVRGRGLRHVALNVAAHNTPAVRLYETMGYRVETMRMAKELGEPE